MLKLSTALLLLDQPEAKQERPCCKLTISQLHCHDAY
ncbi:hypothetical protein FOXB_03516 [Fusarium oxysporum f. sp. conglutinans Fo5176]|uniref:Uncharacterized protein n=1 Tax=Fusarium oxysporum (strain Fo5176) TaxID=660025 RepID=F9FAU0_FUSOF|nr:hypothetical protein FOXB_03516 [Fusarium oxysporum f. sp. conglutinans Fo5176]